MVFSVPGSSDSIRIREYKERIDARAATTGALLHRDGLPILMVDGGRQVEGALIWFTPSGVREAYNEIAAMEPENLYRWETIDEALKDNVAERLEGYSAKAPEDKLVLDPQHPEHSLKYYYQLRSNITHRGKGVKRDFEIAILVAGIEHVEHEPSR
jgi:hypothetical protein